MKLKKTYKQKHGPPRPPFDKYKERIKQEFSGLLATDPDEKSVQQFLELHPCMVPGAWTPGTKSGHMPFHMALITQPKLHGFDGRIPDFMWLSAHSLAWYPAMIEIERPGKQIFTKEGTTTQKFAQASLQLVQWHTWLLNPANQLKFMDDYGVDSHTRRYSKMEHHYLLIYGRRSEFDKQPKLSKLRGNLMRDDQELMSFDRLSPDSDSQHFVTVKAIGDGRFRVIAVPDTFGLSVANADLLASYEGLADAIGRNPNISASRRDFLLERADYWQTWSQSANHGIMGGPGDFWE